LPVNRAGNDRFWRFHVTDNDTPADIAPVNDTPVTESPVPIPTTTPEAPAPENVPPLGEAAPTVNPVRAAAGRLGAQRQQQLIQFGKLYELKHHLTPGRQRLRQLVQLGKRYEQEHGLSTAKPRRKKRGDAWTEFLTALARVVKPVHRPAVAALVAALAEKPTPAQEKSAA
jgi:hypothetical protein